jgi:predicted GH43/DUF377 family glycosyl hydrolase
MSLGPIDWAKRGVIFDAHGQHSWMAHHAQLPVPDLVDPGMLRVYVATRDDAGRARVGMFETDPDDPAAVSRVHERPVLDLGLPGTFDEDGVMPSSIVHVDGRTYLYYVGWSRSVTVPYRLAIGLAVSDDGVTFTRAHEGPVLDRSRDDPYFVASPSVLHESGRWRMWFVSTKRWQEVDGQLEPVYLITSAESEDGTDWVRSNECCIEPRLPDEAQGRPWVVRDGSTLRMWYCYRGAAGFRDDPDASYRIGYAASTDGEHWVADADGGIARSAEGWDSEMLAYPAVYAHDGRWHLLYNGNGFGSSGLGHAVGVG